MSKDQGLSGHALPPTLPQARRVEAAKGESQCTVSSGGRRSTTACVSSVARTRLQPGRRPADKMRQMFSKKRMRSSTTTIKRSLTLSMCGWSCAMTRSGVIFQAQNRLEAQKRGSWTMVHNHQPLACLKARLLKLMTATLVYRVSKHLRRVVRRRLRGRECLSFSQCGLLNRKILP
ncbi:hypothetical protein F2Q69_00014269 [Brassica cretica]|uniref:Uncharacterized protein n=1 Tax=Brassica cretica TaxID=69181 RepID=A0A8S9R2I3_BRACR|nr:hypothetical protein F2Q69_00014269 [Brassica cretica]